MPKVRLVSLIRSRASWAHVSRKLCEALQDRGVEVMIEEDDDGPVDADLPLSEGVRRALDTRFAPDVDFLVVRPERFSRYGRAPLRTGYMVFEADRWPTDWIALGTNHLDLIVTPSTFCRDGLIRSGALPASTAVLPHGIDRRVFRPGPMRSDDGTFRILFVGTPSRRKGLALLLDAVRALPPLISSAGSRIALTIKTERWPRREDGADGLDDTIRELRDRGIEVLVIEELFTEAEMAALYRSHDVLCIPHMGEAFGICVLEAMACACPVVTTAWSGVRDFTDARAGWPIDDLLCLDTDLPLPASFPVPPGAHMMAPRVPAIARKLCEAALAGRNERERRGRAGAMTASTYSWDAVAAQYLAMVAQRQCEMAS